MRRRARCSFLSGETLPPPMRSERRLRAERAKRARHGPELRSSERVRGGRDQRARQSRRRPACLPSWRRSGGRLWRCVRAAEGERRKNQRGVPRVGGPPSFRRGRPASEGGGARRFLIPSPDPGGATPIPGGQKKGDCVACSLYIYIPHRVESGVGVRGADKKG